eukprot:COSAG02_NODE_4109_length_5767_cov_9.135321_5_plen_86_part_00
MWIDSFNIYVARVCRCLETVNLCVNPAMGQKLLAEILQQGDDFPQLRHVFIQPGAGDEALVGYCESAGLRVHQGCVVVELRPRKR